MSQAGSEQDPLVTPVDTSAAALGTERQDMDVDTKETTYPPRDSNRMLQSQPANDNAAQAIEAASQHTEMMQLDGDPLLSLLADGHRLTATTSAVVRAQEARSREKSLPCRNDSTGSVVFVNPPKAPVQLVVETRRGQSAGMALSLSPSSQSSHDDESGCVRSAVHVRSRSSAKRSPDNFERHPSNGAGSLSCKLKVALTKAVKAVEEPQEKFDGVRRKMHFHDVEDDDRRCLDLFTQQPETGERASSGDFLSSLT